MAATLEQTLALVAEESTVDDSFIALFKTVKQQLDDVLTGANLPPSVQQKVDAIFEGLTANKEKVAAALLEGTPQAPDA